MKAGWLSFERQWLLPLNQARRATSASGTGEDGGPRFLVRVDEFPDSAGLDDPRLGYDASARFHAVMAEERIPHLLAVVPQWTHDPMDPNGAGGRKLDDRDAELLDRMRGDRVTFAQHGATHRTQHSDPRLRSEFSGLGDAALGHLLDSGREALEEVGISTRILVPPFNRFDARQWPTLAERYDVITGGPETIRLFGFHGGPLWRGGAVYLPCYPPLYGPASTVLGAVESVLGAEIAGWVPVVLHMSWELEDGFAALRQLARTIAPYVVDWETEFLPVVQATRPR
jgi:hypothetical protein